jgi:hypothetical protein
MLTSPYRIRSQKEGVQRAVHYNEQIDSKVREDVHFYKIFA